MGAIEKLICRIEDAVVMENFLTELDLSLTKKHIPLPNVICYTNNEMIAEIMSSICENIKKMRDEAEHRLEREQ
jgi:hypothetical protein